MKQISLQLLLILSGVWIHTSLWAQNEGEFSGNFQLNAQTYTADSTIGAPEVPEKMRMNAWGNIRYTKGNFTAGLRYESYLNTLQGYDERYNGAGIPYRFVSYSVDDLEVTLGSFYEQFGNGLVLRSYEDKTLGYDNALDGVLLRFKPVQGITLKGLAGTHRYFWDKGAGIVRGIDAEIDFMELIEAWNDKSTRLSLGGSFVSKYQADNNPTLRLPQNVGAGAVRLSVNSVKWSMGLEYAQKANDPSADNGSIYKKGEALLFNLSYSVKGFGFLLIAKHIDNMSFRSDRNAVQNNVLINYLPASSKNHTYSLAAMYPYATQANGETGIQSEIIYTLPRGSKLGGKYGTTLTLNYSLIHNLSTTPEYTGYGYTTDFWAMGDELYFQDINAEVKRKLNSSWKVTAAYFSIAYNKDVLQGLPGYGIIRSQIALADVEWKIKSKHTLRTELQHLSSKQDFGNWAMGLLEYTFSPHWFVSVYDQYNYGNPDNDKKLHYFYATTGYSRNATRFQFGYGKQREGIVCVGGVCRNVPASNGFMFSVSSSF